MCVHVPGWYISNMPAARATWFRAHADRIRIIGNLPLGPVGQRNAWVLVYPHDAYLDDAVTKVRFIEPGQLIEVLGHEIGANGIRPIPTKLPYYLFA